MQYVYSVKKVVGHAMKEEGGQGRQGLEAEVASLGSRLEAKASAFHQTQGLLQEAKEEAKQVCCCCCCCFCFEFSVQHMQYIQYHTCVPTYVAMIIGRELYWWTGKSVFLSLSLSLSLSLKD